MAFQDFPEQKKGTALLQRSLARGRLAHAYLFTGHQLELLEDLARTLAKALNCQQPLPSEAIRIDSCDQCLSCRRIEHSSHGDIHWVRPESKSRIVTVEQMRNLMAEIQLKPAEARYKVGIIVAADRMRTEAANSFLKTLEEPPSNSILILLSTEPQRLLDTLLSRCLRLNFAGGGPGVLPPKHRQWLVGFSEMAASEQKSLLGRYRLLDVLLGRLAELKAEIEKDLTARSPLQQFKDADKAYIDKWEVELAAAIEAEYRRQRAEVLALIEWWLRDIWIHTLQKWQRLEGQGNGLANSPAEQRSPWETLLSFTDVPGADLVAARISASEALHNLETIEELQRWLGTNVQEALALEVGLLKLKL